MINQLSKITQLGSKISAIHIPLMTKTFEKKRIKIFWRLKRLAKSR